MVFLFSYHFSASINSDYLVSLSGAFQLPPLRWMFSPGGSSFSSVSNPGRWLTFVVAEESDNFIHALVPA